MDIITEIKNSHFISNYNNIQVGNFAYKSNNNKITSPYFFCYIYQLNR